MDEALGLVMRHLVAEHDAALNEWKAAEADLRRAENRDRDARLHCHVMTNLKENMAAYLRSIAQEDAPAELTQGNGG